MAEPHDVDFIRVHSYAPHLAEEIASHQHALHVIRSGTGVDQRDLLTREEEASDWHSDSPVQLSQRVPRSSWLLRGSQELSCTIDLEETIRQCEQSPVAYL